MQGFIRMGIKSFILKTVLAIFVLLLLNGCSTDVNPGRSMTLSYGYGSQDATKMSVGALLTQMTGTVSNSDAGGVSVAGFSSGVPVGSVYPFPSKVTLFITATNSDESVIYNSAQINEKFNNNKYAVNGDGSLNISKTTFALVLPYDFSVSMVLTIYNKAGYQYFQGNLNIGANETISDSLIFPIAVSIDPAIPKTNPPSSCADYDGDTLCDVYEDMFINAAGKPDIDGDGYNNSNDSDSDGDGFNDNDSREGMTLTNDDFPRFIHANNTPTSVGTGYTINVNSSIISAAIPVSDPDVGDTHTISLSGFANHGIASISGNLFSYTPDHDFVGTDTIPVQAADEYNAIVNGYITVKVTSHYPIAVTDGSTSIKIRSTDSSNALSDGASDNSNISEDGRYIAFWTDAKNLGGIQSDTQPDLYLKDLKTGSISLVTEGSDGSSPINANAAPKSLSATSHPSISQNGRYTFFISPATNLDLTVSLPIGNSDPYLYDSLTKTITNLMANGECSTDGGNGATSEVNSTPDGKYVVISTLASNTTGCGGNDFSAGDGNGLSDVYLIDIENGADKAISTDSTGTNGNGSSYNPSITDDGKFVAFASTSTNLIAGDKDASADIYLRDVGGGTLTLISTFGGASSNADSRYPSISADGKFIAFESDATNLVSGDSNGKTDIFLWNASGPSIKRISVDRNGNQADDSSYHPQISPDGRFVIYYSYATNLAIHDNNGFPDIFLYDTSTGETKRLSDNINGAQADGYNLNPAWSKNGQYVAFTSAARNLDTSRTDNNGTDDILVSSLTSINTTGTTPVITPNLISNDYDQDGDSLSLKSILSTSYAIGSASQYGSNRARYVASSGFYGLDTFNYVVSDGNLNSTGIVRVAVGIDYIPLGVNDSYTTNLGAPIALDVLTNDSDANGDSITINSVGTTTLAGSTAIISGDTIFYTPSTSITGTDSFTYNLKDSHGNISRDVNVVVTVNP